MLCYMACQIRVLQILVVLVLFKESHEVAISMLHSFDTSPSRQITNEEHIYFRL